jgi:hypothetical protein
MMLVFLDFEASSLARHSYPIEVAWVFEDGTSESHLIRPAPGWEDWSEGAQAIHHIPRASLLRDGTPHDVLARRMVERLSGHDLTASAPSWDGKWLSVLLRAAGLPRHTLRLRDTEAVQRETMRDILLDRVAAEHLEAEIERLRLAAIAALPSTPAAHRALADAQAERTRWMAARDAAEQFPVTSGHANNAKIRIHASINAPVR